MDSKYLFVHRKARCFIRMINLWHALLKILLPNRFIQPKVGNFQRILLCNWAHLGDVLLAASVIPVIRSLFPQAGLGFLVAKGSKVVIQNIPDIEWVHEVENVPLRHGSTPNWKFLFNRLFHFFRVNRRIVKELRLHHYDCAIELYPFFLNTKLALWRAKIPFRLGFVTGGYSNLLTHEVDWPKNGYLFRMYADLLSVLGASQQDLSKLDPSYALRYIPAQFNERAPFIIFHTHSSDIRKELPISFWRSLLEHFSSLDRQILFTGRGEREWENIEQIIEGFSFCENLCNLLSWDEFAAHIQKAELLVSVDSVSVHLAAGYNRPFVAFYLATPDVDIWRPDFDASVAFISTKCRAKGSLEKGKNHFFEEPLDSNLVYDVAHDLLKTDEVYQ